MKIFLMACSTCALLISGAAYAQDAGATIDSGLIHLTAGDGLDSDAYAQGNDRTGGMWQGATSYSAAVQRPSYVEAAPAPRQWSNLSTHKHRHAHEATEY